MKLSINNHIVYKIAKFQDNVSVETFLVHYRASHLNSHILIVTARYGRECRGNQMPSFEIQVCIMSMKKVIKRCTGHAFRLRKSHQRWFLLLEYISDFAEVSFRQK